MKKIFLYLILFFFSKISHSMDTLAKQAIVYDLETNSIIFEKNADVLMSPSSMSKLMTVYYVFKKIRDGEITLNDKFKVSKKAWKKGGSKMFVGYNTFITIEDLLRGIIIQSGNDACITIAEGFSGTEENFALELNLLAREIGLENSNFTNSTGWPDKDHLMTARDILKLTIRTIEDFPDLYKLYSEKEFTYNKIRQINRNPLLFSDPFSDGLKTGHTSLGGFGLTASSNRNNRRIIIVLNGLETSEQRKKESRRLTDFAFNQYTNLKITKKNVILTDAKVWNGKQKNVGIISLEDISITIPKKLKKNLKIYMQYFSPLSAPLIKNQKIGKLIIQINDKNIYKQFPLYSLDGIDEVNFLSKIIFKFKYLIFGESIYIN